jgi:hypothetical protein
MNKQILSVQEVMTVFNLFMDEMLQDKIAFEDYLPTFLENNGFGENSPMAFMFRGFIGGLYIASLSETVLESEG